MLLPAPLPFLINQLSICHVEDFVQRLDSEKNNNIWCGTLKVILGNTHDFAAST
jgi:hypothetical protein